MDHLAVIRMHANFPDATALAAHARPPFLRVQRGKLCSTSGITDDSRFIGRALSCIRASIADDGQQFAYQRFCFNLWHYIDRSQNIVALAAKAYALDGGEQEKERILHALSRADFLSAIPRKPRSAPLHCSEIQRQGIEAVFSDVFEEIRRSLPSSIDFPDDKLFFATPLFDFGEGFAPASIGDGFIRARD